ncbi:MAG: hypothetical protein JKX73_00220, partial [Flavobacteriales bacterium]|nr:hypothetical protein [Flavobacteriales bacterium]
MRITHLCLILTGVLFFSSLLASPSDDSLSTALHGSWDISSTGEIREGFDGNVLVFSEQSFEVRSMSQRLINAGSWAIQDDQLILDFGAKQDTSDIDSTSYIVESGKPAIVFYKDGLEVTRFESGNLSADRDLGIFDLSTSTKGAIRLTRESGSISLTRNEDELVTRPIYEGEGLTFHSIWRGLVGILTCILIAYMFSTNRSAINWALVGKGLLIQLVFALLVLKVPFVSAGFDLVGKGFTKIIDFTQAGTSFLFSSFITGEIESSLVNFAINVLPTIIFFAALMSLLYYWGIVQK